jgi:divalent metal cation (Fe/Co/Zn/Cd) transporter
VLATILSGNPVFDAAGSIAIGALLCVVAVFVAREVASLLVGQSAEPGLREDIEAFVRAQPEVERLFNLITLQLGPDVMVATKAQMRGELSGAQLIDAINRVEAAMRARYPEIRWSFFEPDVSD